MGSSCIASTASSSTRSSALLSTVFDFDDQVVHSNVYQRQMRSLLRDPWVTSQGTVQGVARIVTSHQLKASSKYLAATRFYLEENDTRPVISIPVIGGPESGLSIVLQLLRSNPRFKSFRRNLRTRERRHARDIIRSNLISSMQYLLNIIEVMGIEQSGPDYREYAAAIRSLSPTFSNGTFKWNLEIALVLEILCKQIDLDSCYKAFKKREVIGWDD